MSTFWKVILLIFVLGCAISGYLGYQYYQGVEKAKVDIQDLKLQVTEMQGFLTARKTDWAAYEAKQAQTAEATAKVPPLKQQKEELEKKVQSAEKEFKALANAAREAVGKGRADATERVIPELKLADGKILKDAKIRKLEIGQISFTHSDGIGSVPINQLPPELLEKLDVGGRSLINDVTTAENDIFTGVTHTAGILLKCPVALAEVPFSMNLPAVAEAKRFEGKNANAMEVHVMLIRYLPGTVIDLAGAAAGSTKTLAGLPGMANPKQQTKDVKISDIAAKRTSFSGRHSGEDVFSEGLIFAKGEKMWVVQVLFSSKSKGAGPIVESILNSVQVEP